MSISRKILETKSLCQTICSLSQNEATQTEMKLLYFIDEYSNCSPQISISNLGIRKTNLALITKKMINAGLIVSKKGTYDHRSIFYSLTPKGKSMLNEYLENLDKIFHEQDSMLENNLDEILKYLNKKI